MPLQTDMPSASTLRRIQQVQVLTIAWMSVEAAVSLTAAWMARSPAVLAFGGDSAIELISAALVLWRFRGHERPDATERRVNCVAGGLLFLLAAFVVVVSALSLLGHREPKPSYIGIAVLTIAAIAMPLLAGEKRKLSAETGSAGLRADAAESAFCGYLSLIALVGLGVNAIWRIRWADPIAALALTPLILREGWEAVQGAFILLTRDTNGTPGQRVAFWQTAKAVCEVLRIRRNRFQRLPFWFLPINRSWHPRSAAPQAVMPVEDKWECRTSALQHQ
jgi:divalent metal cation (Fe/Co/Zn/Cd) transporter